MPIDVLSVLCAQLTRDLLAIAKFLFYTKRYSNIPTKTLRDKSLVGCDTVVPNFCEIA